MGKVGYTIENIAKREPWESKARCLDADPAVFYPEVGENPHKAKAICDSCEVRRQCLELAMRMEGDSSTFRYGVWGGTTPDEREKIRQLRAGSNH